MYFFEFENEKRDFAIWLKQNYSEDLDDALYEGEIGETHIWATASSRDPSICSVCGIDQDEAQFYGQSECVD
jgi:hypothetical protein